MIHTRAHLVVSNKQQHLTPAQGGRFADPVGPSPEVQAQIRAAIEGPGAPKKEAITQGAFYIKGSGASFIEQLQAAIDEGNAKAALDKPASDRARLAAPVDEEVEREHARLIGRRVRWTAASGYGEMIGPTTVTGVSRCSGWMLAHFADNSTAQVQQIEVVPGPRESAKPTLADIKVGTRLDLAGAGGVTVVQAVDLATRTFLLRFSDDRLFEVSQRTIENDIANGESKVLP